MNKKQQEKQNEQACRDKFNSVTGKSEPENQNQGYNVKKEGAEAKRRQV